MPNTNVQVKPTIRSKTFWLAILFAAINAAFLGYGIDVDSETLFGAIESGDWIFVVNTIGGLALAVLRRFSDAAIRGLITVKAA